MTLNLGSDAFWGQDRLVVALSLTLWIVGLFLVTRFLFTQKSKIAALLRIGSTPTAVKIFRLLLGGTAVLTFVLSIFPQDALGMGLLLYFILWPLLAVQVGAAYLPWQKLALKSPWAYLALVLFVGFYALGLNFTLLSVAGYL